MKLTIPKSDLARVLTNVGRVIESRNTIPILGNVLLHADNGTLRVTGTDLDIVATDTAPADVSEPGAVCVDAKLLSDIAKKAGNDISLSLEGDRLIVKSGRSVFKLATLPAADFPTLGADKYDATFDIDLAALFGPVAFAISDEQTRYYLGGVFFHIKDGTATAVATDGHRLSRNKGPSIPEFEGVIVPKKTVGLLPKGVVSVQVSTAKIKITAGDFVLTSKLIDGTFPDYERVIPTSNDKMVTVDRDTFMKAADRVATVSSEKARAVKLSILQGSIALSVASGDASASDEVEAGYEGEPMEIGFNSRYVTDIMSVLPTGSVQLALADGGSPAVITGGAEGLTLILMPTRVL
ncbi:DNA polymerase III subunit beta [Rhizobium leucaenae]|uniref:DNA polymerase III subunit beta n=1 Tax=Rhizobium leucaenae TaxID=29450 RepID=UPI00041781F1|nr:DNA polymerase III subunit beta [Rhizobium leucaenae]